MHWSDAVNEHIKLIKVVEPTPALIQRILPLIDLTSLNDADNNDSISNLFSKAQTPFGHVAAVCIAPKFVGFAQTQFANTPIKVATVANFPTGEESLENVLIEINDAIEDGAQEIDVVFPYTRYLAGERQYAHNFVLSCKAACGEDVTLKVILETGALGDAAIIADASYDVLASGADFIKTSTGKLTEGATLEAAATMLLVIRHITPQLKRPVGLKVSGGIREFSEAVKYVALADEIMGRNWVASSTFRIGSSKLVDEMLAKVS